MRKTGSWNTERTKEEKGVMIVEGKAWNRRAKKFSWIGQVEAGSFAEPMGRLQPKQGIVTRFGNRYKYLWGTRDCGVMELVIYHDFVPSDNHTQ